MVESAIFCVFVVAEVFGHMRFLHLIFATLVLQQYLRLPSDQFWRTRKIATYSKPLSFIVLGLEIALF